MSKNLRAEVIDAANAIIEGDDGVTEKLFSLLVATAEAYVTSCIADDWGLDGDDEVFSPEPNVAREEAIDMMMAGLHENLDLNYGDAA